jgi:Putative prokaryotic signal transducing protein
VRKVFSSESIVEVSHLRNVLECAGIRCHIRNDQLSGALGEIPFLECWPELWIAHEGDALRARALLDEERRKSGESRPSWICARCGERLEGQFNECWRCAEAPKEGEV